MYKLTVSHLNDNSNIVEKVYSYTNTGGTEGNILTGLKERIDADSTAVVTAAVSDNTLTLTTTGGGAFAVATSANMAQSVASVTETIPQTKAAIQRYDNDWYGWVLASRVPPAILAAANWTESVR